MAQRFRDTIVAIRGGPPKPKVNTLQNNNNNNNEEDAPPNTPSDAGDDEEEDDLASKITFDQAVMGCSKQGYMTKEGKIFRTWNKRYFVLKEQYIYYFDKKGGKQKGAFDCTAASVSTAPEKETPKRKHMIKVQNRKRILYIQADSPSDQQEWIKAIGENIAAYAGQKKGGVSFAEDPSNGNGSPVAVGGASPSAATSPRATDTPPMSPLSVNVVDSQFSSSSSSSSSPSISTDDKRIQQLKDESHVGTPPSPSRTPLLSRGTFFVAPTKGPPSPVVFSRNLALRSPSVFGLRPPALNNISLATDDDDSDSDSDCDGDGDGDNEKQDSNASGEVETGEPKSLKDAILKIESFYEDLPQVQQCLQYISSIASERDIFEDLFSNKGIQVLLELVGAHETNSDVVLPVLRILLKMVNDEKPESRRVKLKLVGGGKMSVAMLKAQVGAAPINAALELTRYLHTKPTDMIEILKQGLLSQLTNCFAFNVDNIELACNCMSFFITMASNQECLDCFIEKAGSELVARFVTKHSLRQAPRIIPLFAQWLEKVVSAGRIKIVAEDCVHHGVMSSILKGPMTIFAQDEAMVQQCLYILKCMVNSPIAIKIAARILKSSVNHPKIPYSCINLFYNLRTPEYHEALSKTDAIRAMLSALHERTEDAEFVRITLATFKFLLEGNEDNQEKFVEYNGIFEVMSVVNNFATNPEICCMGVTLLSYLTDDDDYAYNIGSHNGVETLLMIADLNDGKDEILVPALRVLIDLSVVLESMDLERRKDLQSLMFSLVAERSDSLEVLTKALTIVYILAEKYEPFALFNQEVEVLVKAAERFKDNEFFAALVFDVVGSFYNFAENSNKFLHYNIVPLLNEYLAIHASSAMVKESAEPLLPLLSATNSAAK